MHVQIADIAEHFLVNKLHNFVLFSSYIAIFPIQLNMNKLDSALFNSNGNNIKVHDISENTNNPEADHVGSYLRP